MNTQAQHAIRAAKSMHIWGRHAALLYCKRRNVPIRLLTLARQLEAAQ